MSYFITVSTVTEIERGRGKQVSWEGVPIAIFNCWGAFYAVEDCCTLCGASLADGELKGSMILCSRDKAVFYLPAGNYMGPGNVKPLTTVRLRVEGDEVQVDKGDVHDLDFRPPWLEVASALQGALKE